MDNTTILYNAIQRVYRNSVVERIREVFEDSSASGIDDIKRLFAKKDPNTGKSYWDSIKEAANERRSGGTGELSTPVIDEYDLIGVEHFWNIFEAHFEILCPAQAQRPKKEKNQAKQALLAWMKQVKNVRDPVSHPVSEDISYDDAYNTLYCARKTLDFCGLPNAAAQILRLQKTLLGGYYSRDEETITDIPPEDEVVLDFVGRHAELSLLNDWLSKRVSRRWALSGEGGRGKSAIAYAFARSVSCRNDHGIEGVFWMSAKRRRFVEGSTVLVDRPDFWNKNSAIETILKFFGEAQTDNPEEKVLTLLSDIPSLLIVDDIDTVEDEGEDAIQFLVMTIPERTKSLVLLTSRRAIFGMANLTTQVQGLTAHDAEEFIKSRCDLMGLPASPVLALKESLLEATDSSPLFIEDLLRLCQTGLQIDKAVGLWADKRGMEARKYAIEREYDQLDDDAKQVLLALSVYGSCDTAILCQGLSWDEERLVSSLQQLRKMFLMPIPAKRSVFTLGQNTQLLVRDVFGGTEAYRRTERCINAAAGRLRTTSTEHHQVEEILRQARLLANRHKYVEAEQLLDDAIKTYPGRSDLYASLGWVQKRAKDYASARMNFMRAHELGSCNADGYWHWSEMEALLKEWNASAKAAEMGLQRCLADQGLLFRLGYALHRQGKELISEGDTENGMKLAKRAGSFLDKALAYGEQLYRNRSLLYQTYRAIVLNMEAMGDFCSLPHVFARWEADCPGDEVCDAEKQRLRRRYPEFRKLY